MLATSEKTHFRYLRLAVSYFFSESFAGPYLLAATATGFEFERKAGLG